MFQAVLKVIPDSFEIVGPDPDYSISIPLTDSDDGLRTVTLDIRLIPKCWCGVDVHELKFLYVVENVETGNAEEIYDRDKASAYVLPVREMIMECVCRGYEALIQKVQPPIIFRGTFAERPPEKHFTNTK